MNVVDTVPVWVLRLLRLAAAVLLGSAILVWVTPVNAPGQNLVPVGCGSPAAPATDPLADFVCRDLVGGAKTVAVALAIAAGVLLLLSELALPRVLRRPWVRGVAVASVLAVPVIALAAASMFATVAASGADGTLIRCGTPLAPAHDTISKQLCGQLPDRDKTLALGATGLALLTLVGAGYVSSAMHPADPSTDDPEARSDAGDGPDDPGDSGGGSGTEGPTDHTPTEWTSSYGSPSWEGRS